MEKSLASALQSSAEEFLSRASNLPLKTSRPILKNLINRIQPSSPLISSLPRALHSSISRSLRLFSQSEGISSPPSKRPRHRSPDRPEPEDHLRVIVNSLRCDTCIIRLCLSHPKKLFPLNELLTAARDLHESLILFESESNLMLEIAGLCEEWWKERLPGRENLISQSLPFLLSRSLTDGKKCDVRRVCTLRDAFAMFDFDDGSIEDLKLLLIRCIITPLYLKMDEGRRFLASLFGLNMQLAREALAMVRAQIPFGRKSILEAYGEVLFRVWKAAEDELRGEIEDGFLQGLIEGVIHARSRSLAASARRVLGGFISQRTTSGVEKLLFRLVEPVLFRSLQVANSNVRENALHLLLDMFPLEDPDATKDVKNTLLEKQFFLLEKLVVDDCPDVRVVAVEGSFKILRLFWEVIPSSSISKIFAKVVDEICYDKCSEVRLSTVNGVIYLLDNPQTHELLKVLLPRFGNMYTDPVLSIRVAIADLLLAVRDIRTFQFNKVVSLDTLLSSLANDHSIVARKITRLLIPSYFPSKVSSKEACNRFIALVRRSPSAAARFCEYAISEGASQKASMELAKVSVDAILSFKALNLDQMDGLFVVVMNICCNLASEDSCQAMLNEYFSDEKLMSLYILAKTPCSRTAVLRIASVLPSDKASGLLKHCFCIIKSCTSISENADKQSEVRAAHEFLLSSQKFDELFGFLTLNLQEIASVFHEKLGLDLPNRHILSLKRKKGRLPLKSESNGKASKNLSLCCVENELAIASMIAWQIKDLLESAETQNTVLNSPMIDSVFDALKVITQVSIEHCIHCQTMDNAPVVAYATLAMRMSLKSIELDKIDFANGKTSRLRALRQSNEKSVFSNSLRHLINCAEKLFEITHYTKFQNSCNGEEKVFSFRRSKRREALHDVSNAAEYGLKEDRNLPVAKRISNTLKMATTVLKFIVDASAIHVALQSFQDALKFASSYLQFTISSLKMLSDNGSLCEELGETAAFVRSSFTYASKLINLVLKNAHEFSPPLTNTCRLASDLLDLIVSIELLLGSRQAAQIITVARPWLPDLILAFSSLHIETVLDNDSDSSVLPDYGILYHSSWLTALCKVESYELNEVEHPDDIHEIKVFSMFCKLVEMMILLLKKGNPKVLDAFGTFFLRNAMLGIERQEFGSVLALFHFVCLKMVGSDYRCWEKLELMSSSLQEAHSLVKKGMQDPRISQQKRHELHCLCSLLESFGINNHA